MMNDEQLRDTINRGAQPVRPDARFEETLLVSLREILDEDPTTEDIESEVVVIHTLDDTRPKRNYAKAVAAVLILVALGVGFLAWSSSGDEGLKTADAPPEELDTTQRLVDELSAACTVWLPELDAARASNPSVANEDAVTTVAELLTNVIGAWRPPLIGLAADTDAAAEAALAELETIARITERGELDRNLIPGVGGRENPLSLTIIQMLELADDLASLGASACQAD